MNGNFGIVLASFGLILLSAFFVAAEYALVGARRSSIDAMAKRGHRGAAFLLKALDDLPAFVAGTQIAITILNIAIGLVAEPFISEQLSGAFASVMGGSVPAGARALVSILSLILITYVTVVFGELVPKYLSLRATDRIAIVAVRPLSWFIRLVKPLVMLVQSSGSLVLRLFRIDMTKDDGEAVSRDELMMLIRSGGAQGVLQKGHADMVTRTLRMDTLTAQDIMIHRLDVQWLDVATTRAELIGKLKQIPHSRIPLCRGDIDDMIGILYLHDIVKALDREEVDLEAIARALVVVPESLTLDRIVDTMRDQKTQMLIVMDEYGGTSGLITLEDVIEEVFGELEDSLESERPAIVMYPPARVSARAEVRFDELIAKLGIDLADPETESLATMVVEELDRVPRPGDSVESPIGLIRVENMARRRITRVSIQLKPEYQIESQIS